MDELVSGVPYAYEKKGAIEQERWKWAELNRQGVRKTESGGR